MKLPKLHIHQDAHQICKLSGFSGCTVLLCESAGKKFVRKFSASRDYNSRLQKQCALQKSMSQMKGMPFKVPAIINTGYENSLFWFDSEYIKGDDAIIHLMSADVSEISDFGQDISRVIRAFHKTRSLCRSSVLGHVENKLDRLSVHGSPKFLNRINLVQHHVKQLSYLDRNETSVSHADMTLENALIDDQGNLNLIDFLDTEHSHYWFSVSKLFQDLECSWYNIHSPEKSLDPVSRHIISKKIYATMDEIDPDYRMVHYPLLALNFLRIIPYADKENQKFHGKIYQKIDYCIDNMRTA